MYTSPTNPEEPTEDEAYAEDLLPSELGSAFDPVAGRVLARLLAESPESVTYEQIESAMQGEGLDPFMQQVRYQGLLNQLDQHGIFVNGV